MFDTVQRRVLANGLEIIVREDPSAPVAALNFFVRVGSLNEDDAIAGWSHGIEHMLFKGTTKRGPGDIAREIQDLGGETNAGTGYESTNYYIVLPASNVESGIDIHADVLRNSTFDEFELEKERQVLIKENEMYRDRPNGFGFTWEGLLAEAFTTHRYQRPIGGPDSNLLRVGRDAIVTYRDRYYHPGNITYVVVGDVQAEQVFAMLEQRLGDWPAQPVNPDVSPAEPAQTAFKFVETRGDVEKSYVKIGFHLGTELDPETDALLVAAHVLGTGRTSRLYRTVRERQALILGSSVLETTGREPGYLVVEYTAEPEKAQQALAAVFTEIQRFKTEPVGEDELQRMLRVLQVDTLATLETMEGQASILGHYALLGDYELASQYLERMASVTPQRIQAAARKFLNLEQATVFAHLPQDAPALGDSVEAVRKALSAVDPQPQASNGKPAAAGAATALPVGSGRPRGEMTLHTLDNGTRVLLQQDGRLPLVALAAYAPVGSGVESVELAGITRMTQVTLMKGAAGRTADAIAETMESLGAHIRPFSSRDVAGVSMGTTPDALPIMMPLFRDVLTTPDFPSDALERERERTLAMIAAQRDNTVPFTVAEFFRRLFPGHAYGRPTEGVESSVRAITVQDLRVWHKTIYNPAHLVLSAVGDFDPAHMLDELEALSRAMPGAGMTAPVATPVTYPTHPVRGDLSKEVSQAVVVLGYPGPGVDTPHRHALDVWNSILSGMGNRLFTRLRDEKHLCYFTSTFAAPLAQGGAVGAYVGTGPEQVDDAMQALIHELELSAREKPTEAELMRAKNTLAGSYLIDMQTRMAWAASVARDEAVGLGFRETLDYVAAIEQVTADDVLAAAAAFVDPSRLVVAVLQPEADAASVDSPA